MSDENVVREMFHTRQVTCTGFSRSDGLWDVEGHLVDTKEHFFVAWGAKPIQPGAPLHEMRLWITIDDELVIRGARASIDNAPFDGECAAIAGAYRRLIGFRIGPGFSRRVKEAFRGPAGCVHVTELLGPMATTAVQTVRLGKKRRAGVEAARRRPSSEDHRRVLDSCHAFRRGGNVMRERSAREDGPANRAASDSE